jgi:RNA polymerase sigma-70 factor, ECF subfamily
MRRLAMLRRYDVNFPISNPSNQSDFGKENMESTLATTADLATDRSLTEGLAAQEFDHLVRLYQRRIYRVLYSLLRDQDLADTLTQECFLRAYRKRATYRGEASVETWLIRIAINLARDHARNRRLAFWRRVLLETPRAEAERAAFEAPDPAPSAERAIFAREQLVAVQSILARLSPQQRSVFALRFFEEMTLEEIAQAMELEVGTVKAHLFRAVSAVRKKLKGQK